MYGSGAALMVAITSSRKDRIDFLDESAFEVADGIGLLVRYGKSAGRMNLGVGRRACFTVKDGV